MVTQKQQYHIVKTWPTSETCWSTDMLPRRASYRFTKRLDECIGKGRWGWKGDLLIPAIYHKWALTWRPGVWDAITAGMAINLWWVLESNLRSVTQDGQKVTPANKNTDMHLLTFIVCVIIYKLSIMIIDTPIFYSIQVGKVWYLFLGFVFFTSWCGKLTIHALIKYNQFHTKWSCGWRSLLLSQW